METGPNEPGKRQENHRDNTPGMAANGRVISYNVSEDQRPGGIKVRFKIRIATGKRAKEITEVLQWQRQHPPRP
jgi:hypothetical protein